MGRASCEVWGVSQLSICRAGPRPGIKVVILGSTIFPACCLHPRGAQAGEVTRLYRVYKSFLLNDPRPAF